MPLVGLGPSAFRPVRGSSSLIHLPTPRKPPRGAPKSRPSNDLNPSPLYHPPSHTGACLNPDSSLVTQDIYSIKSRGNFVTTQDINNSQSRDSHLTSHSDDNATRGFSTMTSQGDTTTRDFSTLRPGIANPNSSDHGHTASCDNESETMTKNLKRNYQLLAQQYIITSPGVERRQQQQQQQRQQDLMQQHSNLVQQIVQQKQTIEQQTLKYQIPRSTYQVHQEQQQQHQGLIQQHSNLVQQAVQRQQPNHAMYSSVNEHVQVLRQQSSNNHRDSSLDSDSIGSSRGQNLINRYGRSGSVPAASNRINSQAGASVTIESNKLNYNNSQDGASVPGGNKLNCNNSQAGAFDSAGSKIVISHSQNGSYSPASSTNTLSNHSSHGTGVSNSSNRYFNNHSQGVTSVSNCNSRVISNISPDGSNKRFKPVNSEEAFERVTVKRQFTDQRNSTLRFSSLNRSNQTASHHGLPTSGSLEFQNGGQNVWENGNAFLGDVRPSPCDSGMEDVGYLLQEKEKELKTLRETMARNEQAILQVLEDKKKYWEQDLMDRNKEWQREMESQCQNGMRRELSLQFNIVKLQQENKVLKINLDSLHQEKASMEENGKEMERELGRLRKQVEMLMNETTKKQNEIVTLVSSLTNFKLDDSETSTTGDQGMSSISEKAKNQLSQQNTTSFTSQSNIKYSNALNEISESLVTNSNGNSIVKNDEKKQEENVEDLKLQLQLLEKKLAENREAFQSEEQRWLEEKDKVINYQKQLQMNYLQMLNRNQVLESEIEKLKRFSKSVSSNGSSLKLDSAPTPTPTLPTAIQQESLC